MIYHNIFKTNLPLQLLSHRYNDYTQNTGYWCSDGSHAREEPTVRTALSVACIACPFAEVILHMVQHPFFRNETEVSKNLTRNFFEQPDTVKGSHILETPLMLLFQNTEVLEQTADNDPFDAVVLAMLENPKFTAKALNFEGCKGQTAFKTACKYASPKLCLQILDDARFDARAHLSTLSVVTGRGGHDGLTPLIAASGRMTSKLFALPESSNDSAREEDQTKSYLLARGTLAENEQLCLRILEHPHFDKTSLQTRVNCWCDKQSHEKNALQIAEANGLTTVAERMRAMMAELAVMK